MEPIGSGSHPAAQELGVLLRTTPGPRRARLVLERLAATLHALAPTRVSGELHADQKLFELGLESLHLHRLRAELERLFGIELPTTLFFSHSTLGSLAEFVLRSALGEQDARESLEAAPTLAGPSGAAVEDAGTAIAVVGRGCRFPGARDPEAFWNLLHEGRSAIRRVPPDRFDMARFYDPDPDRPGRMYMRSGGFLDEVDGFDAGFFKISPREAAQMDPQQRLFLEVAWEALEDAGCTREELDGSATGVFAGILSTDYAHLGADPTARIDAHYYPGLNAGFLAGRLSYFLGTRGPSLTVDATCSSSLVAVHLACQSLRARESDLALAGAVNLILSPEISIFLCKAKVLSPTGQCRAFDQAADGMVRGEGCGVVVLKRLTDALRNGDRVLAVLRGSAVNHDGASGGLTVPDPDAQAALYRKALADARLDPAEVTYVEAHGTGTLLGDPVELTGLAEVYGRAHRAERPLLLGSVKTNLGHTDSAAGMANLLKGIEILRHRTIPASLNFETPTPQFDWSAHPLKVVATRTALPPGPDPLRVGVSSFGLSGVNGHVLLESAEEIFEEEREPRPAGRPDLLVLSAASEPALRELARRTAKRLTDLPSGELSSLCASALWRRSQFDHRLGVVGRDPDSMRRALEDWLEDDRSGGVARGTVRGRHRRRVAFLFSGQGPQWWAMARRLYEREPVFRRRLDRIDEIVRGLSGRSLLAEILADQERSRIDDTEVAQPAMFAVQVGLVHLLAELGVVPDLVMGHSMGEVAAAHCAGAIDLEDAVRVIHHRGRILEQATGQGSMAAVGLSRAEVEELLAPYRGKVAVAADNGPRTVVISGDAAAMREILADLDRRDVFFRELRVKFASHCPQMEPYQVELAQAVQGIVTRTPRVPLVSTVHADLAGPGDFTPEYWARNLGSTVRFAEAMDVLIEHGADVFLEIDPHPILESAITQCLEARGHEALVAGSLHRDLDDQEALFRTLAKMHAAGCTLDRERIHPRQPLTVSLPHYPWQRRRFWLEDGAATASSSAASSATKPQQSGEGAWAGAMLRSPLPDRQFEARWTQGVPGSLDGHTIAGASVVPGAAWLALARTVARSCGMQDTVLRSVSWSQPLVLGEERTTVQLLLSPPDSSGACRFQAFSRREEDSEWTLHASGTVEPRGKESGARLFDREKARERLETRSVEDFYARQAARGYDYSGAYRAIEELAVGRREALAAVGVRGTPGQDGSLSPAVLDACLHAVLALLDDGDGDRLHLPIGLDRFTQFRPTAESRVWVSVLLREDRGSGGAVTTADYAILDERGALLAEVAGLKLRAMESRSLGAESGSANSTFELAWRPRPIENYGGSESAATWLVFADEGGEAEALAGSLRDLGHTVELLRTGPDGEHLPEFGALGALTHVVYAPALDLSLTDDRSTADVLADQERVLGGALRVAQSMVREPSAANSRLWVLTRGAATVRAGEGANAPAASVAALAAVVELEHPALRATSIDLDPEEREPQTDLLLRELLHNDGETRVAMRVGLRHVGRLVRRRTPPAPVGGDFVQRLGLDRYGSPDELNLRTVPRVRPGAGEVEVAVEAAGLNFRDVLSALGLLVDYAREHGVERPEEMPFGHEAAGTITAVGSGVSRFRVGDPVVVALAPGCFADRVIAREAFVVARPKSLGASAAATLPIAFLTASASLFDLARLAPGEHVLIHCATGGVGQAAVQLARARGAVVHATASRAKWPVLRAMGVERIHDSRSLEFVGAIRADTDGRGVDVVLDSLSGEASRASLSLLAPGGRFVEIGKLDVPDAAEAAALRPDVAFHVYDLEREAVEAPDRVRERLEDVVARVVAGELSPLPHQCVALERSAEAFREMAQARHTGKLVLTNVPAGASSLTEGRMVITGGLGGLGLQTAEWLAEQGAGHLVLLGRSAPGEAAARTIERLRGRGVEVDVRSVDLGDADAVDQLFAQLARSGPPVRGVFHSAVALADGVLLRQDLESFRTVLRTRVAGTWNLHRNSLRLELRHFVAFSSTASVLGSTGQANYSAGSAFLDALMRERQARGLPGLSINWGPWSQIGLAAHLAEQDQERWRDRGVRSTTPDAGMAMLGRLLDSPDLAQVVAVEADWTRYVERVGSAGVARLLEELCASSRAPRESRLAERLANADRATGIALLEEHARTQIARVLGLPDASGVEPRQRLFDLGLDSLMAVELRSRLEQGLERSLPSTLIFDYPTLESLVGYLTDCWAGPEDGDADRSTETRDASLPPLVPDAGALDSLSESELAALLAEELGESPEEPR